MIRAVVIEISNKKTLFGILGSDGQCSTGSCEGCQCSRAVKKVSLPSECCPNLEKGMKVELRRSPVYMVHFILLIALPLAVLAAVQILPVWDSVLSPETQNIFSLGAGFGTFLLAAAFIKFFGKKETVTVHPVQENLRD